MILATILATSLALSEPTLPPKESFTYASVGTVFTPMYVGYRSNRLNLKKSLGPDLFVGHRRFLAEKHGFDFGIGGGLVPQYEMTPFLYGQISYLHYPRGYDGLYLGLGLTLIYATIPNIPFTLGYQFKKEKPSFIQLQITPLGTATLHWGFGF